MRFERWFYTVPLRLRSLFRRRQVEDELDQEIRYHLERQIQEHIAKGLTPAKARYAALRAMGGVEQRKEECRDMRHVNFIQDLLQDLRYGIRMLRRNPGLTAIAVLSMALGIGANTAIFSVVNAVLLRPLPYKDPDRIVVISEWSQRVPVMFVSMPNFFDLRHQNHVFERMAAFLGQSFHLTGVDEPERLRGAQVTVDFFAVLGVKPTLGRTFTPDEDKPGSERVAILSYGLWQRRFGGDPSILGRSLLLNADIYRIIGVMPAEFPAPSRFTEVWTSLGRLADEPWMNRRDLHPGTFVYARCKPGIALEQAQSEMDTLAKRLEQQYPQTNQDNGVRVVDLTRWVVGNTRHDLWVLFGAVVFVLLIACANVANLLLGHTAMRRREIAIRTALGARRGRVVRQLLTEGFLLALGAGGLGFLLGYLGTDALIVTLPSNTPRLNEVRMDGSVLAFTAAIAILSGLLFGLTPAWQAAQPGPGETLEDGARGAAVGHKWLRGGLVVVQVALSLVLLVGAGLIIRSFIRLQAADLGFNPAGVLTFQLSLPNVGYSQPQKQVGFYQQLLERLEALPGVDAAGVIAPLPASGADWHNNFIVEDRPAPPPGQTPLTDIARISPDYFRVMQIQLLRGRYFTGQDGPGAPAVVIVDESFVQAYWPNDDAIGKRIKINLGDWTGPWLTIVGVVRHVKNQGAAKASRVETYLPYAQSPVSWTDLVLRTTFEPPSLAAAVRAQVRLLDKNLPVHNLRTLEQQVSSLSATHRLALILLSIFGCLAVVLAAVGVYGVIVHSVNQRTREMGIRMALGARGEDILGLVVGQGLALTLIGVGVGIVGASASTHIMSSLLFEVGATDPVTFVGVSALLVVVSLLACYFPARRASKIDPMVALRHE